MATPVGLFGNLAGKRYWVVQAAPGLRSETTWLIVDVANMIVRGRVYGLENAQACRDALNAKEEKDG